MTRVELIKNVQRFFCLRELVDEPTYKKYGDFAWNFFDTEFLETLVYIREYVLKVPMKVNDWMTGGKFSQRGLRHNMSAEIRKYTDKGKQYMSAHALGKGVDFDAKGMTAEQARNAIQAKAKQLPHPIRLEEGVTWVHLDIYNDDEKNRVKFFKVG